VYAPVVDGKTKNEHFRDMLRLAFEEKNIKAKTILFDNWYAASENLKYIHRLNKVFVTTLKDNRLVSISKEQGYIHLQELTWTSEQLQYGMTVKLKEVPFKVQLFKVVAKNGDIEWVITNRAPGSIDTPVVQDENKVRWFIEQLHRELKQLTGIERCQCRKQRAQRNHLLVVTMLGSRLKWLLKSWAKHFIRSSTTYGVIICVTSYETPVFVLTNLPKKLHKHCIREIKLLCYGAA